MHYSSRLLLVICLMLLQCCARVDSFSNSRKDVFEEQLNSFMIDVRNGSIVNRSRLGFPFTENWQIEVVTSYFTDTSIDVRKEAAAQCSFSAKLSDDAEFRIFCIDQLIDAIKPGDRELGTYIIGSLLKHTNTSDYSESLRKKLSKTINKYYYEHADSSKVIFSSNSRILQLIAHTDLRGSLELVDIAESQARGKHNDVNEVKSKNTEIINLEFLCRVVRARFGDKDALLKVIETSKEIKQSSLQIQACSYLMYVHDAEVVEYMRKLLFLNAPLYGNNDSTTPPAAIISQFLSRMLKDYPNPSNLSECREWMNCRPTGFSWEYK